MLFLAGTQQRKQHGQKGDAIGPPQDKHPEPPVISLVDMIEDPGEEFDPFAPIAAIERVIDNQHFHGGGAGQRFDLPADHP